MKKTNNNIKRLLITLVVSLVLVVPTFLFVGCGGSNTVFVAISAGHAHSMAICEDGNVWTWGHGGSGRLGHGNTTGVNVPTVVAGLSDITAIAAGGEHSMALGADGRVWAWGRNASGQLGLGADAADVVSIPTVVAGLANIQEIAAGAAHSMALGTDGRVWTWGDNYVGQLGHGTTGEGTNVSVPTVVEIFAGEEFGAVHGISTGMWHSTAVVTYTEYVETPIAIELTAAYGLLDGMGFGVALLDQEDKDYLANYALIFEQLTEGLTAVMLRDGFDASNEVTEADIEEFVEVFVFSSLTAAEEALIVISDCNDEFYGFTVALGTAVRYGNVVIIGLTSDIVDTVLGLSVRRDVFTGRRAFTWGSGGLGQLGHGSPPSDVYEPRRVEGIRITVQGSLVRVSVDTISAGSNHTVALDTSGNFWTWGANDNGQLARTGVPYNPVMLAQTSPIVTVSAGGYHNIALDNRGIVVVWGEGAQGQLGTGDNNRRINPVELLASEVFNFVAVSAGGQHSLMLEDNGQIWAFGNGANGRLGLGNTDSHSTPQRVSV